MTYHKPVLFKEVEEAFLNCKGTIVDSTFGGGGHTSLILRANKDCNIIAFDWDKNALEINSLKVEQEFPGRVQFVHANFSDIYNKLKKLGINKISGVLSDFGTSQYQIQNTPGLSFASDSPLDMRLDRGRHVSTAYDIVNKASVNELTHIFYEYGGEIKAVQIAKAIFEYRNLHGNIKTTFQLVSIIKSVVPQFSRNVHPATKVFQALRIVVNDELKNIKSLLAASLKLLEPEGIIACISFHSLEDRLVKQFFKDNYSYLDILTKTPIVPTEKELQENLSSRSAKMRIAKRNSINL